MLAVPRGRRAALCIASCIAAAVAVIAAMAASAPTAAASEKRRAATPSSITSVERLEASGVPEEPLRHALAAFSCARSRGLVEGSTLTLIDYSRPSAQRRLWVIDLKKGSVRFHEHVTHGHGSGEARASLFSNRMGSRQSSLGLFRTAETYHGVHGYSLRLDGLEPGINDLARERAIVIHAAEYATSDFAERNGRLGRSWGCPAVDPAIHRELIDTVRGGTAVFAYYPDPTWLTQSPYQGCEMETASR